MLVEGLPLLEELFKVHGDFTNGFKGGEFLGNILMELLYAVLISLRDSSPDSLSKERLLEWRGGGIGSCGGQVQSIFPAGVLLILSPHAVSKEDF